MEEEISVPESFIELIKPVVGTELDLFIKELHTEPTASIRINPKKHYERDLSERVPWTTHGRYLSERPSFTLDPSLHAGAYYVQESSSMFLEQAVRSSVDLSKPLRVLDLCAAPGGKSTHLLSLLSSEALLVSNEVIKSRASILSENLQKWGYPNVVVTQNDPSDFSKLTGFFDLIVVDAPCSGEGLFRKDREALKHWSKENVELCALRQQRILFDVWPSLKTGGTLVYSTCTYNQKEDENVLNEFQRKHNIEFQRITHEDGWGIEEYDDQGVIGYRLLPHKVRGEGFFISSFKKLEDQDSVNLKTKQTFEYASSGTISKISNWLSDPGRYSFISLNDLIIAVRHSHLREIEFLNSNLRLLNKGTALARDKHGKLVPEHAAALSTIIDQSQFQAIELTREDAIKYLQKEPFQMDSAQKGFVLMTYNQNGIGWINQLEKRFNNLYPANWRIRMR